MRLYSYLLLFLFATIAFAQNDYQQDFQKIKSRYNYNVSRPSVVNFNYFIDYNAASLDQVFHLAVSIQNDFLQFNRENERFTSQYLVSLIIRKDDKTWYSKSWQKDAVLYDFETTNSKRDYQYNAFKVNFSEEGGQNFEDGAYEVLLEVHDKFSSREYKNKRKLEYSAWLDSDSLKNTEIVFLKDDIVDFSRAFDITATKNNININTPYNAFACLFSEADQHIEANIRIYTVKDEEKNLFMQDFYETQSDSLGKSYIKYLMPYKKMTEGKYSIRFSVSLDEADYEIERDFNVLWFLKPLYLYKVDLAVRPLKYLLSPKEMESVKDLEMNDLTSWFNDFWKERDPDSTTVFNELQEVYYKRVTESVRSFSTRFQEGWQTDRGMVYLLYGEPSEVENRKYSVSS